MIQLNVYNTVNNIHIICYNESMENNYRHTNTTVSLINYHFVSAFLIMNINNDLESFDIDKCNKRFDSFKKLHDIEVNRLKDHKNLSSIAI